MKFEIHSCCNIQRNLKFDVSLKAKFHLGNGHLVT